MNEALDPELVAYLRAAFGWDEDIALSRGPRGALGQIWRLDVGPARYALKEIFPGPPPAAVVEAELAFTRRATGAGVRSPVNHPDRAGRHVLATPAGRWVRLYDWVDLRPVELAAPTTPAALGDLLARLHRVAPPASAEPTGEPPDPWYDRAPDLDSWSAVAALAAAAPWAGRLAERLATVPELVAMVAPADPAGLVLCHRDLHPENVLADPSGALVVVDWDNLGPAVPARELARALFDWFDDEDHGASRQALYAAYIEAGGPGRLTGPADFSMLVASRLNFLLRQVRIATDPRAEPADRAWAEQEIDETLRILPTPQALTRALPNNP